MGKDNFHKYLLIFSPLRPHVSKIEIYRIFHKYEYPLMPP